MTRALNDVVEYCSTYLGNDATVCIALDATMREIFEVPKYLISEVKCEVRY